MSVVVVSGTGTDVGKTIATAAVAAAAVAQGRTVAVVKPAQTGLAPGEPGDVDVVHALVPAVHTAELYRYPEPLAPDTAARRAGMAAPDLAVVAAAVQKLAQTHDLVLVEGAGGLLVRLDGAGNTLADLAALLGPDVPVLVVAAAGLGTLNAAALTAEALAARDLRCLGVLVGSWPREPDLAERCNVDDLPVAAGAPLLGLLPEGSGGLHPAAFAELARAALVPELGGTWRRDRG
ncbi:dethiobiotin synthase [Rhodococcus sp. X156]|uniref:dethiobiotin synthase n=1 Tax=Rhodococcus sp. X156 TaxID=2499145 RepID=UPI000FDB8144|nr:dethiobiotin synthase [Rhodococcus sp. X156]